MKSLFFVQYNLSINITVLDNIEYYMYITKIPCYKSTMATWKKDTTKKEKITKENLMSSERLKIKCILFI
jgi:hypothetical protein